MKTNTGWRDGKRAQRWSSPELLVLGHVCRDVVGGTQNRLGGAASFGARAAASLGVQTAVVTTAPVAFPLLAPLENDPAISLRRVPCDHETVFSLDYLNGVRRLLLLQRAPPLQRSDIPQAWRRAPVAYVAPVIQECTRDLVASLESPHVIVGAQGWLRGVDDEGIMRPAIVDELLNPPANVTAAVFSELDHPDADTLAAAMAQKKVIVALTRGAAGATLFIGDARHHIPAYPAIEVDPTGAGDVFGVVFALAMQRGASVIKAAEQAAYAAARVVEGPGMGNLETVQGQLEQLRTCG